MDVFSTAATWLCFKGGEDASGIVDNYFRHSESPRALPLPCCRRATSPATALAASSALATPASQVRCANMPAALGSLLRTHSSLHNHYTQAAPRKPHQPSTLPTTAPLPLCAAEGDNRVLFQKVAKELTASTHLPAVRARLAAGRSARMLGLERCVGIVRVMSETEGLGGPTEALYWGTGGQDIA